jgi:hypothetical protein
VGPDIFSQLKSDPDHGFPTSRLALLQACAVVPFIFSEVCDIVILMS